MNTNRRKIAIVTGSRADYGILYWLLREIEKDKDLSLQLIVTGMHLERKYGHTYNEILKDGFEIKAKANMELTADSDESIAQSTGLGVIRLSKIFKKLKSDIVVILGDRFEMLAAATAALLMRIPIAHIHGGEITEGAYDNSIRHAISKMSNFHFVSHKEYAQRLIRMGEKPGTVFNFGAPGLDNIGKLKLLKKKQLERALNFQLNDNTALVTFHPVTLEKGKAREQIKALLKSLERSMLRIIFTIPNADSENQIIYKEINKFIKKYPNNAKMFKSLGRIKYLSLLQFVEVMIGNSSSGIIEAPSFCLPVVNVGSRQKGRINPKNIINVDIETASITRGIKKALSGKFKKSISHLINPFGVGTASVRIKDKLKLIDLNNLKKSFHEIKREKYA